MRRSRALIEAQQCPVGTPTNWEVSSSSTIDRECFLPPSFFFFSSFSGTMIDGRRFSIEAAPSRRILRSRGSIDGGGSRCLIIRRCKRRREAGRRVQIFSQGPSVLKLQKEKASPNTWPLVKKNWTQNSSVPDGLILVEEIKDEEDNNSGNNGKSQTWGLVVQGRGMDRAASCYILNTSRVRSVGGFCTHFCLVRAKCFGESLDKQLRKAWLQGR
ncbi:uncharacterized protein A4U43_UnF10110 [Asparagus officinalis]|uniref:DUF7804 domain-containing protein n=1 Tax=Asparagus officinalis TaxID=4686 RepID=A0A1R3L5I6_ASPOF|nr:uncharacterized protein A4U43_UnF10110 [Asparagus officinalis]